MVRFYVRKNDRGLYAERVNGNFPFALIDRNFLDKVKEGELWEGEKVREITDKKGRKIPVFRPVRRVFHLNYENDVMCGSVKFCSFEEAKKLGIIEEKVEKTPYIPYVGSRGKTLWRMIPSEYGVPKDNDYSDYWTVGRHIDELDPEEEKELIEDYYRLLKDVLIDLYVAYKPYIKELRRQREELSKEKEKLEREIMKLEWRQKDYIETLSKPEEDYKPKVVVYTDLIPKLNMGLGNGVRENVYFGYMYDSETGKIYEYREYKEYDRDGEHTYGYPLNREVDVEWLKEKYPNIMEEFEKLVAEEKEKWRKEREEMKKELENIELILPSMKEKLGQLNRRLEELSKPTREEFLGILAEEFVEGLIDSYEGELELEYLLREGKKEELKKFLTELLDLKRERYFFIGAFRNAFDVFESFQEFEGVFKSSPVKATGKAFLNSYGFLPKTPQGWIFVFAVETSYPENFKDYQQFAEFVANKKDFYEFWNENLKGLESEIGKEIESRRSIKVETPEHNRSRSR